MNNPITDILLNTNVKSYPTIYYNGWCKFSDIKNIDNNISETDYKNKNFKSYVSNANVTYIKLIDAKYPPEIQKLYNKNSRMKIFKPIIMNGEYLEKDKYLYYGTTENIYKYAISYHKHIRKVKKHFIFLTRDINNLNNDVKIVLKFDIKLLLKSGLTLYTYGNDGVFTDGHNEDGTLNLYNYPDNVETDSYFIDIFSL